MKRIALFLLLVVFLPWPAWATTTLYVNTGSTSGGDCTTNNTSGSTRACATLLEAINLLPGTLTDNYLIYATGTTADTSAIDQTPWDQTTSTSNYIRIVGEQSPNHFAFSSTNSGIYDTGKYRLEVTNSNGLYNNLPAHLRIEGVQVQVTVNNAGSYVAIKTANANVTDSAVDYRVSYSIVKCVQTSGSVIGYESRPLGGGGGGTSRFWNDLAIGCGTGFNGEYATTEVYNSTAVNGGVGFLSGAANGLKCVNCFAYNNTNPQDFLDGGAFASGTGYLASSDTTATSYGSNSINNITSACLVNTTTDFHLVTGCSLIGAGSVDPASGLFSGDIDGNTRGASWDIGMDEFLVVLYEQTHFRWRDDDGSESAATWLASEDTDISRAISTATRLRVQVDSTLVDPASLALKLQYKLSSSSFWLPVPTSSPASGTLDYTVNLGTDDAQQTAAGGTMALTGTTIGADLDATTDWAGMRWDNVQIPVGATITAAYISVVPSSATLDEPLVNIYFEDADDPGTFTTTANDISTRARTTGVAWSSTDLGANGSTYFNSPSLVSDLQTVVNRGGWAPGNALVVLINSQGTGTRDLTIESFENTGNNPPKLHVEYTVPVAFVMKASANITASGENTTRQLTIPSGKASGDFDGGRIQGDENPGDAVDLTLSGFREDEWAIEANSNAVASSTYQFRVVTSAEAVLDTYTVTPEWTIDSGGATQNFFYLRRFSQ